MALSKLWLNLEAEVQEGARLRRPLIAFGFVLMFLIVDKMGWLPPALSSTEFATIQSKVLAPACGDDCGRRGPEAPHLPCRFSRCRASFSQRRSGCSQPTQGS